jgi:hypothetical protein
VGVVDASVAELVVDCVGGGVRERTARKSRKRSSLRNYSMMRLSDRARMALPILKAWFWSSGEGALA